MFNSSPPGGAGATEVDVHLVGAGTVAACLEEAPTILSLDKSVEILVGEPSLRADVPC